MTDSVDILGLYLNEKREEMSKPSPLTDWRFVLARAVCPDCREEYPLTPMLGYPAVCPGCRGIGLVLYGPFQFAEDKPPICAAYLLMESGNQSWIWGGTTYDFPSGEKLEDTQE